MRFLLISVTCVLTVAAAVAWADRAALNTPVIHSAEHGKIYARSVPADHVGDAGVTRVYRVGKDSGEDILLHEYDWYSADMQIFGTVIDPIVVRFGHRPNGRGQSPDALAIGFYREGNAIREYSTLEMHELGSGVSHSVSSHAVFRNRGAMHLLSNRRAAYTITGVSEKEFTFDLATGAIIKPEDDQSD
ncbi:MAG: hypothetical protein EA376_14450 [Phycisphaeraceae bacterium]|nr:MAG: hypothetical protein EA376_14450 [Phycisphaeraceae bacterium]